MGPDYEDLLARALVIAEAAARLPVDDRPAYIHGACGQEPELLQACLGLVGRMAVPDVDFAGKTIGNYVVQGVIGRGGSGKVYAASRIEPAGRVAIKFLRPDSRTADDLRRFRWERHILSALDHEHIVRFLDHGETSEGWPYLVMPLVKGTDIVAHCQAEQATLRQRLELFLQLVSAVEHAHGGFIHRDLKPANVLVASETNQVRILDFGVAKGRVGGHPDDVAADDTPGAAPLTPEYASPEQLRGQDVTTKSDVYQLGLILFQLLAGRLPFARAGQSEEQRRQAVCFDPAPAPSAVATDDAARACRLGSAAQLRRHLRGDLDAIVREALHTRPNDRYPSATALAADIRSYLHGRPVEARRGGWLYRAGKGLRRHWLPVALLVGLLASLGVGVLTLLRLNERKAADLVLLNATRSVLENRNETLERERQRSRAAAAQAASAVHDQIDATLRRRQLDFAELYEGLAEALDARDLSSDTRAGLGSGGEQILVEYRRELLTHASTLYRDANQSDGAARTAGELDRLERTRGGPAVSLPDPRRGADTIVPLARVDALLLEWQLANGDVAGARQTGAAVLAALASREAIDAEARALAERIRASLARERP